MFTRIKRVLGFGSAPRPNRVMVRPPEMSRELMVMPTSVALPVDDGSKIKLDRSASKARKSVFAHKDHAPKVDLEKERKQMMKSLLNVCHYLEQREYEFYLQLKLPTQSSQLMVIDNQFSQEGVVQDSRDAMMSGVRKLYSDLEQKKYKFYSLPYLEQLKLDPLSVINEFASTNALERFFMNPGCLSAFLHNALKHHGDIMMKYIVRSNLDKGVLAGVYADQFKACLKTDIELINSWVEKTPDVAKLHGHFLGSYPYALPAHLVCSSSSMQLAMDAWLRSDVKNPSKLIMWNIRTNHEDPAKCDYENTMNMMQTCVKHGSPEPTVWEKIKTFILGEHGIRTGINQPGMEL